MDFIQVLPDGVQQVTKQATAMIQDTVIKATANAFSNGGGSGSGGGGGGTESMFQAVKEVVTAAVAATVPNESSSPFRIQPITWMSLPDVYGWFRNLTWSRIAAFVWYVWFEFTHALSILYKWVNVHTDLTVNLLACTGIVLLVMLLSNSLRYPEQDVYNRQVKKQPVRSLGNAQR